MALGMAGSICLHHGTAKAAMTDLPEGCLASLNAGTITLSNIFGALQPPSVKMPLGGHNGSGCNGYTWTSFTLPNGPNIHLQPMPVTNVNSSEWDCNHTALTWGLYIKPSGGSTWVFLSGGNLYGKLVRGACTYDPTNFPSQSDSQASWTLPPVPGAQFRIATRHWQHDDPAIGHTGQWCQGLTSCNHDTTLLMGQSKTWSGVFVNTDWDTVYSAGTFDWDPGYTKGTCAPGWTQSGMSNFSASNKWAHEVLCRYAGIPKLPGEFVAKLTLPGDQRRMTRSVGGSIDWAPGRYKLECGNNEYVSGSSQAAGSSNPFHSVLCAQASFSAPLQNANCSARVFDTVDSDGAGDNEDWDPGYLKGECGTDQYLAGVSVTPSTSRPYSLLCCPR
jgi:hypothetical protein